jgi:hypothetical protein
MKIYVTTHFLLFMSVWFFLFFLISEKKIFEISANQSILLALAAMMNIQLEQKT